LQISTAENADAALEVLQQQRFDLVLLDLNLNGESGLRLLQRILQLQPDARVIMLTAYASVATAVDAIKRGAENYLCKPVNASDIAALLTDDDSNSEETLSDNPLSVDRLEWEHLQRVLMEHAGNISATARALNMHRRTLQRKLQKRPVSK
jgi:two-component system response regulator RegA